MKIKTGRFAVRGLVAFWLLLVSVGCWALEPQTLFNFQLGLGPVRGALIEGPDGNFYGTTSIGGPKANGTVFRVTPAGVLTILVSDQPSPAAGLVVGNDGLLYGMTETGGPFARGSIFKTTTSGVLTNFAVLDGTNGENPTFGLVLAGDGNFYGASQGGGAHSVGAVFRVTPGGTVTLLFSFDLATSGGVPAGLTLGPDGNLYGSTTLGGSAGHGTIFKITTGGAFTTLFSFQAANGTGGQARLAVGPDRNLYGTTPDGGSANLGTIFRITTNGNFATLVSFTKGAKHKSELTVGADGQLYGTTQQGGSADLGTVFKVTTNGVLTTLVSFTDPANASPEAGLLLASDGNFYGSSQGSVFRMTPGGVLTHLVSLLPLNGIFPQTGLVLGPDGNFYGTTSSGGSNSVGTIFRLTPNGVLRSLFSFNTTNGALPQGGLALGRDGNFYGTTAFGGPNDLGTIFRFSTNGTLTTLASFDGSNGANPQFQLAMDANGNFYGVTAEGGADGVGTVFRVTTNGVLTTLASFNDSPGAVELPEDGLTAGQDGNFYGTTAGGGSNLAGTVFKITPGGVLTTLASFNGVNGTSPRGGLVQANDGNLYGTTGFGGTNSNFGTNAGFGTIFKVTTNGVLTSLFNFHFTDGEIPSAKLIFGSDGNLYGTTTFGGSTGAIPAANGVGTVFRVSTNGVFTSLSSFQGTNGSNLQAPLVLGNDGNLYGTTSEGGTGSGGTIFRVVLNDTTFTNSSPTVAITSPTNGASFIAPATITIEAAASDSDGSVTNVQFFDGDTSLGNVSSSPYNLSVSLAVGPHALTAVASDNLGATKASLPVTVTVTTNSSPTVAITSPTDGSSFIGPATITIQAAANDSDGSVTNVQFFDGDTSLGNVSSSPYNLSVSLAVGPHALTAVASDNLGATTASLAVTATVTTNTPPNEVSIPDPGLNAAIRQALQKPAGTLTVQELLGLTNLDAHGRNIQSLQGLEAAGNLVSLNLQSNQLSNFSLPSQFTNLMVLDLSLNSLTNCSFPGGLMKLATLNLEDNLLTSLTLPAGLNSLSSLELSENRFNSFTLPSNLTSLRFFDLSINPLTNVSLPNGLTNLLKLVIRANNVLTNLDLPQGLTALETLDIDNNLLEQVSLPADLKSLTRLNLEANQLSGLTLPAGMTNLVSLFLDRNHLDSLALPADLTKLAFLDVTGSKLTNVTLPDSLTALTNLDLAINRLSRFTLPSGLTNLTRLDLFGNALTSLTLPAGLIALTNLNLGVNQLTSFTVPADATNLTTLLLSFNRQMTNVSLPTEMRKLDTIDLSDNQLGSLELPSGLTALASLNLSNNQLTDLTLPLDMTNLTMLLLDGNPLRTLTLSQQLATTNLAALVASLRNQGVSVIILQTTPNSPPVLAAIPNQTIPVGMSLVITNLANDPNSPPQVLTFSLGAGAAANASINPASGLFNLRPPTAAQVGTNTFTVIVTDNGQPPLSATQSFSVVVLPTNSPPTIAITSPTNGTSFTAPATITIQAAASDSDGSITNVQFFDGTNSLGNASSSPYLSLSLAVGSHALTALASDNLGATTTSLAVTVTVTTNSPPTVTAIVISGATKLSDGAFQFAFTNTPGASFTVLTTTNSAVPVDEWTSAGAAVETSPGSYQFTDETMNSPQRFYRVRSP